jgi:proteasome lid subunit RPN8/RPN11
MAKAAKVKVRVSTQPVVVMEAEVARQIRQHARTSMKAEVCGVLIGGTEQERMTVEACIQGINAAQGGAHVTFTQDTWEHIYKIKDKEYPDQKIVGWYHSHPGFGVFLSEHDLFIQQNFFSNPQQVAWVYDPHTDEEGCFGWVGDKIEKLTGIRVGYLQSLDVSVPNSGVNDYEEEDDALDSMVKIGGNQASGEPAWVHWTSMALGYLAAVILGVAGGFYLRSMQVAPKLGALELMETCRQMQWQPAECQDFLMRLVPGLLVTPGSPPPQVQPAPQGQSSPASQVQASPQEQAAPTPKAQASPAPQAQVAPTPAPAKSPQNSPQEKAPAQKGNNGKH